YPGKKEDQEYQPDAPARVPEHSPRWRVGLVCRSMRNFLAGVISPCAAGYPAWEKANRVRDRQPTANQPRCQAGEEMAHQFVRAPLRAEEADRLANACRSREEKLIVWTLLDTGLRVSELCALTLDNVQRQQWALRVAGKGGPHGTRSKQRVVRCPH